MTKFEVEEFEPSDLIGFMPQDSQLEDFRWTADVNWKEYRKRGFVLTARLYGEAVCVGGIVNLLPRIGECWIVVGHQVHHAELRYLFKAFKRVLQSELQTAYDRIQMTVDTDFEPGVRMAEMLGMSRDGEMKNYPTKHRNSYLYSRTS